MQVCFLKKIISLYIIITFECFLQRKYNFDGILLDFGDLIYETYKEGLTKDEIKNWMWAFQNYLELVFLNKEMHFQFYVN